MPIYTYVIDHGKAAPRIKVSTDINGGRLVAVAFVDVLEELDEALAFIDLIRDEVDCVKTRASIDDFRN